jgi:multiple sugar transport system permease protein
MNDAARPSALATGAASPLPRRRSKGLQDRHLKYLLLLPAIVLVGATSIGPLFSGLYLAFRDWNLAKSAESRPLWSLTDDGFANIGYLFDNFTRALSDSALHNSLWVTLVFTVLSVVITIGLALGIALLLV